jgi:hypothetical protein
MARTALSYTKLAQNTSTADPAGTAADATNGMVIKNAVPEQTILRVTNTAGSTKAVTVRAGDYPPAIAAGQGDLVGTVAATSGVLWLGPFESGRFIHKGVDASGNPTGTADLYIDFASGISGNVTAFRVQRH